MMLPETTRRHAACDEVTLDLALPAYHPVFRGHFPGQPVLAGAAQVDWAMRLAGECFALDQRAAQDFQVKFRQVITPADLVSLTLHLDRPRAVLNFAYRIGTLVASSGKIRLEPRP
jgi:3-hydroxymyristoyl/3-hydroxydecanoyl-(acyl carrier protein) dehydratase